MKKYIVTLIWLLCGLTQLLMAQSKDQEVGVWVGSATYIGDINPNYNFLQTRPAFGALYRYHLNPYVGLRGSFNAAMIQHADSLSSNPFPRARNLSFRANLIGLTGQIELNFHKFIVGNEKHYFSPYITVGLGLFYFETKTKFQDEWYNLRELGTEGQLIDFVETKQYKPVQANIPVGMGVKYWMRGKWSCYAELSYHFTSTDYLDDVGDVYVDNFLLQDGSITATLADRSGEVGQPIGRAGVQRGDITANDAILMLNLGITYTIFANDCPQGKPKKYDFY